MIFCFFEPERKRPNKAEKEALLAKQGGKCMYCGRKLDPHYAQVDHKTPTSRGGKNSLANRQVLCSRCNTRKGDKTDGEFRRRYPFLKSAREAKGPPSGVIPQSRFDERDKELRKSGKPKKKSEWGW